MNPKIVIKRAYEPADKSDGYRVLVDRLWPRGVTKERAAIDEWAKDITPSTEIRLAFRHMPERWPKFEQQYLQELKNNEEIPTFLDKWEDHPLITFVFAAKDPEHNHALILQKFIQDQYQQRSS